MHETDEDLAELQQLLDESYATADTHLQSIFAPQRRSQAADVAAALPGAFLISLATVTAKCEPLVAPLDGLFYRGRLWLGLPPGSQRARHLLARPRASATYTDGDACLIVHGVAREVGATHPLFAGWDAYVREVYGALVGVAKQRYSGRTEPGFTGYIEARRVYAQGFARVPPAE